ncbi:EutN/CcmL family microcompartment protein [Verminephrobacter eiseniae]|uniref:Ethanolamine utilization protein EutN/carboxysome structural protein Ccml n=1 Tax=Verminephrobacter eiseniae (strain EF01-2) TaxID=391735 RepID=A1WFN9_VEREI|nr:EutN/CcmL family microcompartment protein [Verminephrobacter eiseniae]ABM56446.1 Ethanolamine utilization protein EutN/carboxysome structural protein Ccml [Verminephrobacter eiseniae EF01-2]MCW5261655.1 ethanolamine utilization protein EutN [Verminephrobacter eiseniae]MCW5286807.1 ethanolamine utilization protein EutN [Verminephrobacter eiseniae]MCW5305104.1 ethanolamine utilization protein EutN [Verminephrobacter eiseniae]MCW8178936.1 ethanolamine utilization protein EutN [Verminephrobacte
MIRARVNGKLWSTRHLDSLPVGALLEVETESGAKLIAFDPLGCAEGESVLVTQGSVAAAYFPNRPVPIDALIIGSIDEVGTSSIGKTKSRESLA